MNPAVAGALSLLALFIIAACAVRILMGPASVTVARNRVDDLMDLADAVQDDEPVPYLPVDVDPLSPADHAWLQSYGISA